MQNALILSAILHAVNEALGSRDMRDVQDEDMNSAASAD